MVTSQVERSLGVSASLPTCPKGAHESRGNPHRVTLTLPTPRASLSRPLQRKENPNAAFSVMKRKPPGRLLGSCDSQTPACDSRKGTPNTQDPVFFAMQNANDLARRHHQHLKAKPPGSPVQVGSAGGGRGAGEGGGVGVHLLDAVCIYPGGRWVSGYVCAMRWPQNPGSVGESHLWKPAPLSRR